MQTPQTDQEWIDIAKEFWMRWQYPCCIGAVDGKHIRIKKPAKSGSKYYNYKGFFSIILMAIVKANYEIIYIDTGYEGRFSDGGIWAQCTFKQYLDADALNIPDMCMLPITDIAMPLHLAADDAFPLSQHIKKPFSHRHLSHDELIYNYRISRVRRIVENVFGILSSRFRVLLTQINFNPRNTKKIVKRCCILHNILTRRNSSHYLYAGSVDGEDGMFNIIEGDWRDGNDMTGKRRTNVRNARTKYKQYRENLKTFFNSTQGKVSWQEQQIEKSNY